MLDRVILTILLMFHYNIVFTNPNTANEMGRQVGDKPNNAGGSIFKMLVIRKVIMVLPTLLSVCFRLYEPLSVLDWSAFIVSTIGLSISFWAYLTLGNYYTFTLGIRKDHKIVTDGPYKYFAHPGYLGQFLITIASTIFYRVNIFLTISICIYIIYAFVERMRDEEAMLIKEFGDEYKEFVSSRWRMMPGLFEILR